jgi:lipid A 3-O-deacylase
MNRGHKNKMIAGALTVLAIGCAIPVAQAQQAGSNGGVSVQMGVNSNYNRTTVNYETAPLWNYDFGGNWGRLDLTGELGLSYWWAHQGEHPSNAWQASAIPMFRWWLGERFFIEGGVGPTVFNKTHFADKTISTAFQFGDHIGVGFQLTQSSRISLRYSHFSNASIKTPNPGLDVTQLTYTYLF